MKLYINPADVILAITKGDENTTDFAIIFFLDNRAIYKLNLLDFTPDTREIVFHESTPVGIEIKFKDAWFNKLYQMYFR